MLSPPVEDSVGGLPVPLEYSRASWIADFLFALRPRLIVDLDLLPKLLKHEILSARAERKNEKLIDFKKDRKGVKK